MKVVELVIYKLKPEAAKGYVNSYFEEFKKLVQSMDGFIEYKFYQSAHDEYQFMDFVMWESLDFAQNARSMVKEIQQTDEFKQYIDSFESLIVFDHFRLK